MPIGTEYIVMECIVMEGGDDMQLAPGEVVELVKVEGSGSLRVRTKDEHPFEGNIPAGFLRRKDSVRGGKMESESWHWVLPLDLPFLWIRVRYVLTIDTWCVRTSKFETCGPIV